MKRRRRAARLNAHAEAAAHYLALMRALAAMQWSFARAGSWMAVRDGAGDVARAAVELFEVLDSAGDAAADPRAPIALELPPAWLGEQATKALWAVADFSAMVAMHRGSSAASS